MIETIAFDVIRTAPIAMAMAMKQCPLEYRQGMALTNTENG